MRERSGKAAQDESELCYHAVGRPREGRLIDRVVRTVAA